MTICTLDIETVPLEREELSDVQKKEKEKRVEAYQKAHPEEELEHIQNFIGGTSAFFGRILVLCYDVYNEATDKHLTMSLTASTSASEKNLLERFTADLKKLPTKSTLFVHYNGLAFDIPFIIQRCMHHRIKIDHSDFLNLKRFSTKPHFDLKEWISNWSYSKAVSLELACDHLGVASPKEGEVKGAEVYDAFKKGKLDQIEAYCQRDVKATFDTYQIVKTYV